MNYEVNENTFAIVPTSDNKCRVVEDKRTYNINKSSFKVIEHSCEYFGVSYQARLEGSQKFIKTKYKSPIIIEESSRLVFFPISSSSRENTVWISYNNIMDYYPSRTKKSVTVIRFKNGLKMEIPVSYYSFNNQYLKASRLSAVVADRIIRKY